MGIFQIEVKYLIIDIRLVINTLEKKKKKKNFRLWPALQLSVSCLHSMFLEENFTTKTTINRRCSQEKSGFSSECQWLREINNWMSVIECFAIYKC